VIEYGDMKDGTCVAEKLDRRNQTVSSWCKIASLRRTMFEMPRPKGLIE